MNRSEQNEAGEELNYILFLNFSHQGEEPTFSAVAGQHRVGVGKNQSNKSWGNVEQTLCSSSFIVFLLLFVWLLF